LKKVDCLIISTGRAGSTAIYQYINQAAELGLPLNKEPHYWCNINRFGGLGSVLLDIYMESESEYFNLYSKSKIHLDASVGYFFCIDEVIDNLNKAKQDPKIIYLYREPISRASSLFYEERRKNQVSTDKILDEVCLSKSKGLWWENYYDNVAYFDVLRKLEENFKHVLCINQSALQFNGELVIDELLKFLELEKKCDVDLTPINSSAQATIVTKLRWAKKIFELPIPFKREISKKLIELVGQRLKDIHTDELEMDLEKCLSFSNEEYKKFREHINSKDIFLVNSTR
jgi:hypothetical protein